MRKPGIIKVELLKIGATEHRLPDKEVTSTNDSIRVDRLSLLLKEHDFRVVTHMSDNYAKLDGEEL